MYVFIDAKTYNLDVFQRLKRTNRYVFLAKKRKNIYVSFISLRYSYQCILSISNLDFRPLNLPPNLNLPILQRICICIILLISNLDFRPLTYPQT